MQINRLFGIVHLLLHQKQLTSTALAQHFEVSKRTILRDIDILSSVGIPIYTTKGKGGGIAILDSYTLNKTAISDNEQMSILNSLQGFNSLSGIYHNQPDSLLSKLSVLFGKQQINWLAVDFANWTDYDQRQIKFDLLKNAVITYHLVEFTYFNSSGESTLRKVCPLKLLFKSQDWYLHAYCQSKQAYRFFKLNRINQLILSDRVFDPNGLPAPNAKEEKNQSLPLIEMVIQFSPQVAYRVYDEFPQQYITNYSDGSLLVTMMMTDGDWLLQYLLSYGCHAKVLSPQKLIDALKKMAITMIHLYS